MRDALERAREGRDAAAAEVARAGAPLAGVLAPFLADMACEPTATSCLIALASGIVEDWSGVRDELDIAAEGSPGSLTAFQTAVTEGLRHAALVVVARNARDPRHPQRQDAEGLLRGLDGYTAAQVIHILRQLRRRRTVLTHVAPHPPRAVRAMAAG